MPGSLAVKPGCYRYISSLNANVMQCQFQPFGWLWEGWASMKLVLRHAKSRRRKSNDMKMVCDLATFYQTNLPITNLVKTSLVLASLARRSLERNPIGFTARFVSVCATSNSLQLSDDGEGGKRGLLIFVSCRWSIIRWLVW